MNIGILGAGWIGEMMAKTVAGMKGAKVYAVASRDIIKANAFAEKYKIPCAYGSYEDMVKDPEIDLVYVATPHSHHAEHVKLCIENNKNVLCEKAFTMNAKQAKEIIALAKKNKVYLAEAIWTRYMPSRKIITDFVESGIIGKVNTLTANLSYSMAHKERIMKPELAGGALLDLGVYCLNFAFMNFGNKIDRIESSVQMTKTKVDAKESITVYFKDGNVAYLTSAMDCRSDRKGILWGDKGYIVVENINNPQSVSVYDDSDRLLKSVKVPKQITGYEYQVYEAMAQIKAGKLESESMPLDETVFVMEVMDKLRKDWKMVYPQEKKQPAKKPAAKKAAAKKPAAKKASK